MKNIHVSLLDMELKKKKLSNGKDYAHGYSKHAHRHSESYEHTHTHKSRDGKKMQINNVEHKVQKNKRRENITLVC